MLESFERVKKGLTKTRPTASQMMKKSDGTKCTTQAENSEVFREHFENLFDRRDLNIMKMLHL